MSTGRGLALVLLIGACAVDGDTGVGRQYACRSTVECTFRGAPVKFPAPDGLVCLDTKEDAEAWYQAKVDEWVVTVTGCEKDKPHTVTVGCLAEALGLETVCASAL